MRSVLQDWLDQQCRLLSGTVKAMLLAGPLDGGAYEHTLVWPEDPGDLTALEAASEAVMRSGKAVLESRSKQVGQSGEPLDVMGCPVFLAGRLHGVVAIELTHRSPPLQRGAVQQVQLGNRWLETLLQTHSKGVREQLVNLLDLVAVGLDHDNFKIAAAQVSNEIAERFSCQRVSIGFLNGAQVRVEAMSRTTRFDRNTNLVVAMQDAMGEALDQGAIVLHPPASSDTLQVTRFHARLSQLRQGGALCTIPLVNRGHPVGALLLERDIEHPFEPETLTQCEQVGHLLGPVLAGRWMEDRPLPAKLFAYARNTWCTLIGPRHLALKTSLGLIAVLLVWFSFHMSTMRISCDSTLEASIRRSIVAPQHGYIAEANVRAGDLVREGDSLAILDDDELLLEQRKWKSQRAQLLKEYRQALARLDRAEVSILKARLAQADAQLKLVEQQLARTVLTAPVSGLVVKGDLTQALGSPVAPGDVLYEVAPIDEYRVVMKVDDRDIALVECGQKGHLKLSAIPDTSILVTIDRITPVSVTEDGRNYFRVEALMANHSDLMRPGMEGITKLEIGEERLLRIWTRRLVDWLRLLAWQRMP